MSRNYVSLGRYISRAALIRGTREDNLMLSRIVRARAFPCAVKRSAYTGKDVGNKLASTIRIFRVAVE